MAQASETLERTRCYMLRGRLWVPHYIKPKTYVTYGGKVLSLNTLELHGAMPVYKALWRRPWQP